MSAKPAMIIDAIRSPMGRPGGAMSQLPPAELLVQVLKTLLDRNGLAAELVDSMLVEWGGSVPAFGRPRSAADLPMNLALTATSGDHMSSQQLIHFAAQSVIAGEHEVVVVAGVEASAGASGVHTLPPGIAAELTAAKWKLSREELDEYALRSNQRAVEVSAAGEFRNEVAPVVVWTPDTQQVVSVDEALQGGVTAKSLAELPPAFADHALSAGYPEIEWVITEGNSAPRAVGVSALLITGERMAKALDLVPRARFRAFASAGGDSEHFAGAVPATRQALARSALRAAQVDHFEVGEPFAALPLAWQAELDVNPDLLNPRGGAIALGEAPAATGPRLMTTMLNALETTGGRYGLQVTHALDGMATATVIERP